jgi:hypothetical protein
MHFKIILFTPHMQSVKKSYWIYLQNYIQNPATSYQLTATTLIWPAVISHLAYRSGLLPGHTASTLTYSPHRPFSPQHSTQVSHLKYKLVVPFFPQKLSLAIHHIKSNPTYLP